MNEQFEDRAKIEKKKFSFLEEREKLLNNLETARRLSAQVSAMNQQLSRLLEESQLNRAETRALKTKLNHIAIDYGLTPIPFKVRKPRKKSSA